MKWEALKAIVEGFGQKYSEILGINLKGGEEREVFKWFLASILFGAPITEKAVIKTYKCFQKHDVLTPKRILDTGWDGLVRILDEGSYTRYDYKTADKLLLVMGNLTKGYDGSLTVLHRKASDERDLKKRLRDLGKGVGDVTVSIFLRELRGVWGKADPKPTELEILAARRLGIVNKAATAEGTLAELKDFWSRNKVRGYSFVNFETALVRLGKDYFRKGKRLSLPS